ncbi:hypothetical protein [Nonomuraea rubra]|uniref:hypothetical protein n=1 Tax=Nonomuraea rubra TaxID=46180 RepID=UPI0031EEF947
MPWLELDSIFHMRDVTPRPEQEFRAEVDAFTSGGAWVVDGNYSAYADLVWRRADTVVWFATCQAYGDAPARRRHCAGWPRRRAVER